MIDLTEKDIQVSSVSLSSKEVLNDYCLAYRSRQVSLQGRREVMGGKAKFGIFGDGKEVPQIAMAKVFQKGDIRSGYYRDQTFMFAIGEHSLAEFFAQLYANPDLEFEPASSGRAMNAHFATRSLNKDGSWKMLSQMHNSAADISPTAAQMPRLVGLGYASRLYREIEKLHKFKQFSNQGREIAFGTIGNASCAEGMFWESINAIGVLKAPTLISIWDDEYGISVPNEYQITRGNISELLKGFQRDPGREGGFEIFTVQGWNYPALIQTYQKAEKVVREERVPVVIHVIEVTQPQGHSTSGSHERYKPKSRLEWEREYDCVRKMREWILGEKIATAEMLDKLEAKERKQVTEIKEKSWEDFMEPIQRERDEVCQLLRALGGESHQQDKLKRLIRQLEQKPIVQRKDLFVLIHDALFLTRDETLAAQKALIQWKKQQTEVNDRRFGSHLYSESRDAATRVAEVNAQYSNTSQLINGFEIVNACFNAALGRDPRIIAFGEDVGYLGDVNQGFRGLQSKFGTLRVSDTGIRECTIIGQAIGMALRGLRPIAEIQYLDYILFALHTLSDDLATVHWRTRGGQKAPVIVRTRGHRLEGIWHAGSPMAGILNLVRGMHVLVPRNMTQAAGFYNTLLKGDEPAIVVEVLNAYRLKEKCPDNIGEFTVPLGKPEILRSGNDVTLVTYGACCRLALDAAKKLAEVDIDVEVVDIQSLLPFDIENRILESLKKTSRIVFLDEDVPGGTTAYMMQEVLEKQQGYHWLDSQPRTLSAKPHRPAYGSDGDYFSKPNTEIIVECIYELMHEVEPKRYPIFYR